MEANSVTGPAKNLIGFCRWTRSPEAAALGLNIETSIATFCREPDDGSNNAFVQAARSAGIPVHSIRERFRFDPHVRPQMAEAVKTVRPDVVQTHNVKSHFLFKSLGSPQAPWLAFQHGYTDTDLKMKLYNQLDRWSLRSADRVVTVCSAFIPKLVSYGVPAGRVRVLHNSVKPQQPIPPSVQEECRTRFRLGAEDPVILTIGRFSEEKGHADLVAALGRLQTASPGLRWKAVFVGAGPEQVNIEASIVRHGLSDRVVLAGFHSNVAPFYAVAQVFVLQSHSEGSSNVLLEAMSAKVPIIATRVGGTPEIVSDEETALLVPPRDPDAMGRALHRMLADAPLRRRLSEAACERARTAFSPEQYMHSLTAIYCDALAIPTDASLYSNSVV